MASPSAIECVFQIFKPGYVWSPNAYVERCDLEEAEREIAGMLDDQAALAEARTEIEDLEKRLTEEIETREGIEDSIDETIAKRCAEARAEVDEYAEENRRLLAEVEALRERLAGCGMVGS